jgi:malate dehydrogenase (oxaloacetate-decarboxylating)
VNVTGIPLKDHRIVVFGGGSAGCGISSLLLKAMIAGGLPEKEARRRFFLVDRQGLLLEGMPDMLPFQQRFAQPRSAVADWRLAAPDRVDLLDVVRNARPTVLIGVSGQSGAFSRHVVSAMARSAERPVIFPLSNPTSRSEATPADLIAWTEGRAVIGTGSPFPPVRKGGALRNIDQTNNAYVFPGLGLGTIVARARRVSDDMLLAAAHALADASPARLDPEANLLPPINDLRDVSYRVALAVAQQADKEGIAEVTGRDTLATRLQAKMWSPAYRPYRRRR